MSVVGEIKASRHAPQRNDTAIKLCIKVAFDILCNYIYIHLGKGLKESSKCIHKNSHAFDQGMYQRYDNQKRIEFSVQNLALTAANAVAGYSTPKAINSNQGN